MTRAQDRAFAELALATCGVLDDDAVSVVGPVVVRAAAELGDAGAPAGLLFDLAQLFVLPPPRLDLASARASHGLPTDDAALVAGAVGTLDSLVAPVAVSPALVDVRDALVRHPRDVALEAAGVIVAQVLERIAADRTSPPVPLADLRRALARPAHEIMKRGVEALADKALTTPLARAYEAIARAARRRPTPLGPADVALARGANHLRHRAARLALAQLSEARAEIARRLPVTIARRRSRATDVTTNEHDESTYPMGGFSSMTNVGSLENVVTSELSLAEDGDIAEDLFAIRWATGELLYYTRDESLAHRRSVLLALTIDASVAKAARVKDRGAPYQRAILALAAIAALTERACQALRAEALEITLFFPPGGELDEERALVAILLADAAARGVVSLVTGDALAAQALAEERRRTAHVLRIDLDADPAREGAPPPEGAVRIEVGPRPALRDREGHIGEAATTADPLGQWADVVRAIVSILP